MSTQAEVQRYIKQYLLQGLTRLTGFTYIDDVAQVPAAPLPLPMPPEVILPVPAIDAKDQIKHYHITGDHSILSTENIANKIMYELKYKSCIITVRLFMRK